MRPPRADGRQLAADARRVVVFLLGVLVILDALIGSGSSVPELIVGTVLVGVLPLEYLVKAWRGPAVRPRHRRGGDDDDG